MQFDRPYIREVQLTTIEISKVHSLWWEFCMVPSVEKLVAVLYEVLSRMCALAFKHSIVKGYINVHRTEYSQPEESVRSSSLKFVAQLYVSEV